MLTDIIICINITFRILNWISFAKLVLTKLVVEAMKCIPLS